MDEEGRAAAYCVDDVFLDVLGRGRGAEGVLESGDAAAVVQVEVFVAVFHNQIVVASLPIVNGCFIRQFMCGSPGGTLR